MTDTLKVVLDVLTLIDGLFGGDREPPRPAPPDPFDELRQLLAVLPAEVETITREAGRQRAAGAVAVADLLDRAAVIALRAGSRLRTGLEAGNADDLAVGRALMNEAGTYAEQAGRLIAGEPVWNRPIGPVDGVRASPPGDWTVR